MAANRAGRPRAGSPLPRYCRARRPRPPRANPWQKPCPAHAAAYARARAQCRRPHNAAGAARRPRPRRVVGICVVASRAGRPRHQWPAAQSARGLASRLRPVCRDTWKENAGARTLVSDALLRGLTSSQPPLAWDGLAGELPNTPGFSSSGKLSTSGASTAPDQVEPRACLAASALAVQTLTAPLVAGVWEGGDVGVTLERALALAQQNGAPPLSAPQLCTHILRTLLYGAA